MSLTVACVDDRRKRQQMEVITAEAAALLQQLKKYCQVSEGWYDAELHEILLHDIVKNVTVTYVGDDAFRAGCSELATDDQRDVYCSIVRHADIIGTAVHEGSGSWYEAVAGIDKAIGHYLKTL